MTREELLEVAKPIFFNTDMVKAILDGRKTATRRVIEVPSCYPYFYKLYNNSDGKITGTKDRLFAGFFNEKQIFYIDGQRHIDAVYYTAPYKPGDILYVRESGMIQSMKGLGRMVKILFAADNTLVEFSLSDGEYERLSKWEQLNMFLSPYWLTKEECRIWLRVTDVGVERLQDITQLDIMNEGVNTCEKCGCKDLCLVLSDARICYLKSDFIKLWNSTIKKTDIEQYGWDANPFVWVIEFERVKPDDKLSIVEPKWHENIMARFMKRE